MGWFDGQYPWLLFQRTEFESRLETFFGVSNKNKQKDFDTLTKNRFRLVCGDDLDPIWVENIAENSARSNPEANLITLFGLDFTLLHNFEWKIKSDF